MNWPERHRRLSRGEETGSDHVWSLVLRPLSWLYRGYAASRNAAYDAGLLPVRTAGVPVVSVGSLTAGGTGKTPLLAMLGNHLHAAGWHPLLVVRGYRAPAGSRRARLVSDGGSAAAARGAAGAAAAQGAPCAGGTSGAAAGRSAIRAEACQGTGEQACRNSPGWFYQDAGDEAVLLSRLAPHCAVAVARRREEALDAARAEGVAADVLLLDGAFQHRRLARSLDIISLDASRHPGVARLLPWGDFREPWSSLRRAQEIVLFRAEVCPDREAWRRWIAHWAPQAGVAWCSNVLGTPYPLDAGVDAEDPRPGQVTAGTGSEGRTMARADRGARNGGPRPPGPSGADSSWDRLRTQRVGLYAGIGSPESFLEAVRARGVTPVWTQMVSDHAPFGSTQARVLAAQIQRAGLDRVLITEKDAVRMEAYAHELERVAVVPASLRFATESEGWPRRIEARLPRRGAA